ncbi:MAG: serine/threonine protein kinase, partial [Reyranellaceae bacterium]
IVLPVLDGLEDVHQAGFLHRDIKPANILIRANGQPVLIDFGAARQALGEKSRSITSVFTPGYAPFEQYTSSGKQGPWTDIYALAATLYHGVTGKVPVQATDRIREDAMEPAIRAGAGRYSEAFLAAIDAGLEVFENRRPQSVAQWRAMLTGDLAVPQPAAPPPPTTQPSVQASMPAASTAPVTGTPASQTAPPQSGPSQAAPSQTAPAPRRRGLLAAIGIVVLLVLAGGGYAAWTQIEAERIATEQRLQQEAEARAAAEKAAAELQAREAARLQAENEAKARAAAEARRLAEQEAARRKAEADARAREEAEARIRAETEAKIRAELEATRKAEEEARRRAEAESRRKAEEEAKKRAEAEMQARAQAEAEAKAKAAAEEKARREAAARAASAAQQQQAAAFAYSGTWRLVIDCPNTPVSPFSDYTISATGPTLTMNFYRDGKGQGGFAGDRFTYRFGFTGRGGAFLRGVFSLSALSPTRFAGGGTVHGFGQGSSERNCTAEMTKL